MKLFTMVLYVFVLFYNGSNSANILGVFYIPSPSHHMLGSVLLKELAVRGHNITMLSPFPLKEPLENYTDIVIEGVAGLGEDVTNNLIQTNGFLGKLRVLIEFFTQLLEAIFTQKSVRNLLESDSQFDAIMYDALGFDMMLGFSHRFNAPAIFFSPYGDTCMFTDYTGNIYPLSYLPANYLQVSDDLSSFTARLKNVVDYISGRLLRSFTLRLYFYDIYEKYFPDYPPLPELNKYIAVLLLNSHFTYEMPRPYTPNMIQIGGFNMVNTKLLDPALKKWLDAAEDGVIFLSYGSKIDSNNFDENKTAVFVNTFAKFKQKVLWKFDLLSKNVSANVRVEKWFPQKEVLNHPNVKLFITHGGMGGVAESIYGGVPMIGTPFYGDQVRNVKNMVNYGYGLELDFKSLSEESLTEAINEILNNPKYYDKIQVASSSFKNQPICPLEKAIFWIEHVCKHKGAEHLKPASLKLSPYQANLVDVYAFLAVAVLALTYISYIVMKKTARISYVIFKKTFPLGSKKKKQ